MTTALSDTENVAAVYGTGSRGTSNAELCAGLSDHIDSEEQLRVLLFLSANREQEYEVVRDTTPREGARLMD